MMKILRQEKGITLIALVVTIIVLLLLAGISIQMLTANNGILQQAIIAKEKTTNELAAEMIKLSVMETFIDGKDKITDANLRQRLDSTFGENNYSITGDEENGWKVKKDNVKYKINPNGEMTVLEEKILVANGATHATTTKIRYITDISEKNENEVEITKDNAKNYYGLVVDYTPQSTQIEYTDGTTDPMSSIYRIFYIDFDNKYQEGENTIYLKADPPIVDHIGQYHSQEEIYSETETKIEQFNPSWKDYDGEINTQSERQIAWMCDPTKWTGCLDTDGKAKYAIGGVSTDMLTDSFASLGLNTAFNPTVRPAKAAERVFPYRYHNEILYTPHSTQYNLAGFIEQDAAFVYCDTGGIFGGEVPEYLAEGEPEVMRINNNALFDSSYLVYKTDQKWRGAYSPCVVLNREVTLNCSELNGINYPDTMTQEQHYSLIMINAPLN